MNILIYNEFYHEKDPNERAHAVYPDGMHAVIADFLRKDPDLHVRTVTLENVEEKPFMRLMGTSCSLIWRESDDMERIWVSAPYHPITAGLDRFFEIPAEETYGEPFGIPTPDETVFIGWFTGGEVFRSGCTWQRGWGRVFYFQPGHESYPIFYDPNVQTVIRNAVRWASPVHRTDDCMDCPCLPKAHKGSL